MRIEAHLSKRDATKIEVVFYNVARDRAETLRKQVPASRYVRGTDHGGGITFSYPLSVEKCRELRDVFGTELKVAKPLAAWYRYAVGERAKHVSIGTQTDAELTVVPARYPDLASWLKGDQRVTAQWISKAYRGGGLLADEMGTGKTAGVVAGLIEAEINGPTLIVCPKISVRAVWGREFARHTPDVPVYLCRGTRAKREKAIANFLADPHPFKVLVVVAEMLRLKCIREKGRVIEFLGYEYPELFDITWSAVVVDESQRVMGSMDVVKGNLAGEGLKALSYAKDRLKLAVSATPFGKGGRIEALFGTLHWLWPDEFPSRWAWLRKYFEVIEDKVFIKGGGGSTRPVRRIGALLHEEQLWYDLGARVLRRTMEDVSPEHRGMKNFVEILCDMDDQQRKQYASFAADAELALDGGILDAVGPLDYMTRCRQLANGVLRKEGGRVVYTGESGKIDRLLMHLGNLEVERKVVVASQWNEYLDIVEKRLLTDGYWTPYEGKPSTHPMGGVLRIDGKTSDTKRDEYMNLFQTSPVYNVFLINSQAGGVSISLDAAEELHALDEMYPPEANTQLYGRIFRRGRAHEVIYYLYRTIGTIDEQIGYKVGEGHAAQLKLLDGRRGKAYLRTLAQYREENN